MSLNHLNSGENALRNQSSSAILAGEFDENQVLLPYQQRWIADTSQLKIAEKSRRTGLTWAEAADAALNGSMATTAGGCDTFYVGTTKDMAREFIDACAMWAKAYDWAASDIGEEVLEDEDKDILVYVINFASGFKIKALSSNPSNLRGMQGNVIIDEAAFQKDLAAVLKAALALTMWGSNVRLISTHNGIDNLFNELINDSRAGKKRYSVHTVDIDLACAEGLYQRICQVSKKPWSQAAEEEWKQNLLSDTATEEDALEEYYCKPKSGGGAYLNYALIESRMAATAAACPVISLAKNDDFALWPENLRAAEILGWCRETLQPLLEQLDPERPHVFGEDFARSGDLTVIDVGEIAQDLHVTTKLQVELKNIPFSQQEQILLFIGDRLPRFRGGAMDARGNGQSLAEKAQDHWGHDMVAAVMLSESFYREHMPRFKAHFQDGLITIPRDDNTQQDLRALTLNHRGTPCLPQVRTGQEKDRHGDAAISLFLMVYATTLEGCAIEYTPLPTTASRWDGKSARRDFNRPDDDDDFNYHTKGGCW